MNVVKVEPKLRVLALPLSPPLSALDCTMCKKYIQCLSNMAYARDAQAKSFNKSNTWAASRYRGQNLDRLKSDLFVSPQKDLMQAVSLPSVVPRIYY